MKKRNHEIYLTWVTGCDQSILQQLYAVMFFCWFATDFTKFVHQWWIILSFQRSMCLFFLRTSISSILHHLWWTTIFPPNPSFDPHLWGFWYSFWLKKWRCTWRSLCFLGPCFHRQRWKGYPVGIANKKNVAASHGMFETSGWCKDENLRDHWFPLIFLGGECHSGGNVRFSWFKDDVSNHESSHDRLQQLLFGCLNLCLYSLNLVLYSLDYCHTVDGRNPAPGM